MPIAAFGITFDAKLYDQHKFNYGDPVHYVYRIGYDYNVNIWNVLTQQAPVTSYMWVKNTNRSVKDGAIMSQAGMTFINQTTLYKNVVYGPQIWSRGINPAGNAIESVCNSTLTTNWGVQCWGYGKVRDPNGNYHDCNTHELFIDAVPLG